MVYKDYKLSFDEPLRKDNSVSIHHRNLQKLAIEMYKPDNDLLIKSIFPTREISYNLRNCNPFKSSNVHTVFKGTETIYFRGPKIWDLAPKTIKVAKSLSEFKRNIRCWVPTGCTCRLCKTFVPTLFFYKYRFLDFSFISHF